MMHFFSPFLILPLFALFMDNKIVYAVNNKTFWHITDIHVDQNYSRNGDTKNFCHQAGNDTSDGDLGLYGNFLCDSPLELVNLTIESMHELHPNPEFIIWTGDNLPHVWDPDPSWNSIYEALSNISSQLMDSFPGISIFPSIGNHDSSPPNELTVQLDKMTSMYNDYLVKGRWGEFITTESAKETFLKGGYYSMEISQRLQLISLNTILWYEPNKLVENITDPADQFEWLQNELENARATSRQVYIIGHVPPGFYNKVPLNNHTNLPMPFTYHLKFLEKYLQIIWKYSQIIAGQFFGHLHLDSFQLFQFNTGVVHSSSLLASSVTPWHSGSEELHGLSLPVNPSVRLMYYDEDSGVLLDYNQYFLNLTWANQMTDDPKPEYKLLYTFTKSYNVSDVSTESLAKVYGMLSTSQDTFQMYNHYMTAGFDSESCVDGCKLAELCAILCTSSTEYTNCIINGHPTIEPSVVTPTSAPGPSKTYTTLYVFLGMLIAFLVALSVFMLYRAKKKKCRNTGEYQHFPDF